MTSLIAEPLPPDLLQADRHEMSTLRRRRIPPGDERHLEAAVDLRRRGWWHRLAPPGTRVVFDARWPRSGQELAAAHPRLFVASRHDTMAGYGLHFSWLPALRARVGLPTHVVAELGVGA